MIIVKESEKELKKCKKVKESEDADTAPAEQQVPCIDVRIQRLGHPNLMPAINLFCFSGGCFISSVSSGSFRDYFPGLNQFLEQ